MSDQGDITEELRSGHRIGMHQRLCRAADEIDNLRAKLADRSNEASLVAYAQSLEAKLESARKALEPLAKINLWTDLYPDGPRMLTDSRMRGFVKHEDVLAARAALTSAYQGKSDEG